MEAFKLERATCTEIQFEGSPFQNMPGPICVQMSLGHLCLLRESYRSVPGFNCITLFRSLLQGLGLPKSSYYLLQVLISQEIGKKGMG